jgi:FKBP-type peptidyl-prolyl cis-trans isomerase
MTTFTWIFRIVRIMMKALALTTIAFVALLACGCGGDSSTRESNLTPRASPVEARERSSPEVRARDGVPPSKLVHRDLVIGTGSSAEWSKKVVINFVGYDYKTGRVTGSSWENGKPSDFELSSVLTVEGLRKGMLGMKAGGRREVIIPPRLAFGWAGAPPEIPPNATVVYMVDLLGVQPAN